jgi:hypothetical protein
MVVGLLGTKAGIARSEPSGVRFYCLMIVFDVLMTRFPESRHPYCRRGRMPAAMDSEDEAVLAGGCE